MTDHSKEITAFDRFISKRGNFIKLVFLIVILTIAGAYLFRAKSKAKICENCQPYKDMTSQLLDALKNAPTSYEPMQTDYKYAVYSPKSPWIQTEYSPILTNENNISLPSLLGDVGGDIINSPNFTYEWYWSSDTTKPMTQQQWNKYKDSIIIATQKKIDSLKKNKNK